MFKRGNQQSTALNLQWSAQNNCVGNFNMADGSLPTTYLRFIPVDMHLDQRAYLQKKNKKNNIKRWPAGAEK